MTLPGLTPSPAAKGSIRAILVDDERLSRKALRELLQAHPSIKIVGEADGVEDAWRLQRELHPEVIFLDVQMSPLDGFELVNRMFADEYRPEIIFVTAFESYAIAAFEAHALGYLTKPIVPARLANYVARLESILARVDQATRILATPAEHGEKADPSPDKIHAVYEGRDLRMIRAREIYTIQSEGNYTRLQLQGGRTLLVRKAITAWEASLPKELFLKISKSWMINRNSILAIKRIDRNTTYVHVADLPGPLTLSRVEGQRLRKILGRDRAATDSESS